MWRSSRRFAHPASMARDAAPAQQRGLERNPDRDLSALDVVQKELPLIFPVHPRTASRLKELVFGMRLAGGRTAVERAGRYLDSLCLLAGATVVLTDSGGVQEETTVLGVPCLTIRENTERPVTITEGTNYFGGNKPRPDCDGSAQDSGRRRQTRPGAEVLDGRAAERMCNACCSSRRKE